MVEDVKLYSWNDFYSVSTRVRDGFVSKWRGNRL